MVTSEKCIQIYNDEKYMKEILQSFKGTICTGWMLLVSELPQITVVLIQNLELRLSIARAVYENIKQFTWGRACHRLERFLMSLVKP